MQLSNEIDCDLFSWILVDWWEQGLGDHYVVGGRAEPQLTLDQYVDAAKVLGIDFGPYASLSVARYMVAPFLAFGGLLLDIDLGDEIRQVLLSRDRITEGLRELAVVDSERYARLVDGQYDAIDIDLVMQWILFGHVVFC